MGNVQPDKLLKDIPAPKITMILVRGVVVCIGGLNRCFEVAKVYWVSFNHNSGPVWVSKFCCAWNNCDATEFSFAVTPNPSIHGVLRRSGYSQVCLAAI